MKIESVKMSRTNSRTIIEINGMQLERVLDYRVTTGSEEGTTVLELKIDVSDSLMNFESSVSRAEPAL